MNAMKPILTVSLGVPTESLSRRLDDEGIIYRWQQAASEQLLLVDSESNSERIAELIHDWRLEQSSARGMVDVQSIKTWLARSTRLFPLTVLLMVITWCVSLPGFRSLTAGRSPNCCGHSRPMRLSSRLRDICFSHSQKDWQMAAGGAL